MTWWNPFTWNIPQVQFSVSLVQQDTTSPRHLCAICCTEMERLPLFQEYGKNCHICGTERSNFEDVPNTWIDRFGYDVPVKLVCPNGHYICPDCYYKELDRDNRDTEPLEAVANLREGEVVN